MSNGYVKSIHGCGTFATPGTPGNMGLVPQNYCTGPAGFTLNLRVAKTWGFGRPHTAEAAQAGAGPDGPGGPGGGPSGGHHGGGHHGHGPMGGNSGTGHLYNFTLGAQAQNVFNIVDRSVPVGTLTSPVFGASTQLAGFIYTTDSAVRRIMIQTSFSF